MFSQKEIISIAKAKNSSLIATGEFGENPSLHLWDSETLRNIAIMTGVHQNGIHLLSFFDQDKYIASCGIRKNTPILIYSTKTFELLLSTYVFS